MLELSLELEPRLEAGQQARQFLADRLRDQLGDDALEAVLTVVTELVNNSVLYGRGEPIQLSLDLGDDGCIVGEVVDQGDAEVAIRDIVEGEGGYGLRIVDALTERWMVLEGSTTVRFEMRGRLMQGR